MSDTGDTPASTSAMDADEYTVIRADITAAVVESQWVDRALLPDLLDHLLTALGQMSQETYEALKPFIYDRNLGARTTVAAWADALLRECQIRAVSQIPFYGRDLEGDEPPHWEEHR